MNKKVRLRERKRHTARHVASACYAALSPGWGEGGTPSQVWMGGCPIQTIVSAGWGTPWTWDGVPPISWMGYPLPGPGTGYPSSAR